MATSLDRTPMGFPICILTAAGFISLEQLCACERNEKLGKYIYKLLCSMICACISQCFYTDWSNLVEPNLNDTFLDQPYVFFMGYFIASWGIFLKDSIDGKHKNADFWIMVIHHVATALALFSSDVYGYRKIGNLIISIHCLTDCWVNLLKITQKVNSPYRNIVYGLCMFSWILFRIGFFVGGIICYEIIPKIMTDIHKPDANLWHLLPCFGLFALAICNLGWTYMLLRLSCKTNAQIVEDYECSKKQ